MIYPRFSGAATLACRAGKWTVHTMNPAPAEPEGEPGQDAQETPPEE